MGYVKSRLSLMMFLQYAMWGLWLPILDGYLQADVEAGGLGFTPSQVFYITALAAASGAFIGPFIGGQMADRYFSAERFLATLLIVGGAVQWILAAQTSFVAWLILSVVYSICFQPTIALTNSIAFSHLTDANNEFPRIRVWGTIAWIAAGWVFPMVWLQTDLEFHRLPPFLAGDQVPDATARLIDAMRWSGALSIGYAVYCLFLPHTPPKKDVADLAFTKAFALIKRRSVAVLVITSLFISVIHQAYFAQTFPFFRDALGLRDSDISPAMTIGQFAEILVMAGLGLMLTRLGFRFTMAIGGTAYLLRYLIFGTTTLPTAVIISSQALHGFCFACFFATAFIYIDRIAPDDVRHSAQTAFGIIILGAGPLLSAPILSFLAKMFTVDGVLNYSSLWYSLAAIAALTTTFFVVMFRDETTGPVTAEVAEEEPVVG
ncbi:MAG: MFS transporter [Candidatus Hydrogenedentota bacterium]